MSDDLIADVSISPEARTFVVTAIAASLAAFDFGFDLGAFDNIDHRKFWAVWVLCTVALVASYLFRDRDYRLGGWWRLTLTVPSVWLLSDMAYNLDDWAFMILVLLSVLALPFGIYVLARLIAGDFFALTNRLRVALLATTAVVFVVGLYIGDQHPRFLSCDDFARAGEFTPADCRPSG